MMTQNGFTGFLCAILIGVSGCRTPAPTKGAEAFERNCGGCHTVQSLAGTRARGLADPQKKSALDQFLAQHHAPDAAMRAEIIDHLATQTK